MNFTFIFYWEEYHLACINPFALSLSRPICHQAGSYLGRGWLLDNFLVLLLFQLSHIFQHDQAMQVERDSHFELGRVGGFLGGGRAHSPGGNVAVSSRRKWRVLRVGGCQRESLSPARATGTVLSAKYSRDNCYVQCKLSSTSKLTFQNQNDTMILSAAETFYLPGLCLRNFGVFKHEQSVQCQIVYGIWPSGGSQKNTK